MNPNQNPSRDFVCVCVWGGGINKLNSNSMEMQKAKNSPNNFFLGKTQRTNIYLKIRTCYNLAFFQNANVC